MTPWWLRPPADDGTSDEPEPAAEPRETPPPQPALSRGLPADAAAEAPRPVAPAAATTPMEVEGAAVHFAPAERPAAERAAERPDAERPRESGQRSEPAGGAHAPPRQRSPRQTHPRRREGREGEAQRPPARREGPPGRPADDGPASEPLLTRVESRVEDVYREAFSAVLDRSRSVADERKIALFCDLENIAIGVRDSEVKKFDINLVLERLLEKGKIIVKRAYADWERYSEYKRTFHEAGIELIDIPQKHYSGKNSADIKMVVDAMDLCYSKEHLDTFVVLSGDSDFTPLVSKLKENNKVVIGLGVKGSSSTLLIDNCDEFIYYEDVWRDVQLAPKLEGLSKKTADAFHLMVDAIQALMRENKGALWGSMIKQTMQRKRPSFNEGYYGYSTFSELLEDAEQKNVIKLKKDPRSGTYIVVGFAGRR